MRPFLGARDGDTDAEALVVTNRLVRLDVELDQRHWEAVRKEGWDPADGTGFAFAVVQRDVAFSGGVELQDLRDADRAILYRLKYSWYLRICFSFKSSNDRRPALSR